MSERLPLVMNAGKIQQLQTADHVRTQNEPVSVAEGRLSPATGNPTGTSASFTTIYYTLYTGNKIALYDGTRWKNHTFAEASVAVPSTLFRMFDVFGYDNSGTFTLETANWSQTTGTITDATNASPIVITSTAHGLSNGNLVGIAGIGGNTAANGYVWQVANVAANTFELLGSTGNGAYTTGGTWYKITGSTSSNLTTQNGVYVKSGETNKRYLGIGMTIGTSGACQVDTSHVLLVNAYNQLGFRAVLVEGTSHTYASNVTRPWNNDGKNYRTCLAPANHSVLVIVGATPQISSDGLGANPQTGVGNGNISSLDLCNIACAGTVVTVRLAGSDFVSQTHGFGFFGLTEARFNAGTGTFTSNSLRLGTLQ